MIPASIYSRRKWLYGQLTGCSDISLDPHFESFGDTSQKLFLKDLVGRRGVFLDPVNLVFLLL